MATVTKKKAEAGTTILTVSAPNLQFITFTIRGTSPYCQNRFGNKAGTQMIETQRAGSAAKGAKKRDPKDFEALGEDAKHKSTEGWVGIPATAFRSAMISACRVSGVVMTKAKLAVFVMADGYDQDMTPLVKIAKGEPTIAIHHVRNDNGSVDMRPRPMWEPGWEAKVTVQFDADVLRAVDVANLMCRAGLQVGVGEGRHDSKKSNGCGWGLFLIADQEDDE